MYRLHIMLWKLHIPPHVFTKLSVMEHAFIWASINAEMEIRKEQEER